jgi:hypothetical protein
VRAVWLSKAMIWVCCGSAAAADVRTELPHDTRLEQAMKDRVATRMGDIRPGFEPGKPPAFVSPDMRPAMLGAADASAPSAKRGEQPGAWSIAKADDRAFSTTSSGSFQTFSDGSTISPEERRQLSRKTVSRIINF